MGRDAWEHGKTFIGSTDFRGMCKAFVRGPCCNVEPSRSSTAREAWAEVPASGKHLISNAEDAPAFVWVFMNTSAAAEHAVYTGPRNSRGHRLCLTVDAGPNRSIAVVSLAALADAWGPVVGWGEFLDGQRIWTPPAAKPEAPTDPSVPKTAVYVQEARSHVRAAMAQLDKALANGRGEPIQDFKSDLYQALQKAPVQ